MAHFWEHLATRDDEEAINIFGVCQCGAIRWIVATDPGDDWETTRLGVRECDEYERRISSP